jgi:hypothetical protein
VALKPYGFDSGPDDRRVSADTLNFSRAILVRELLVKLGDGGTAIWAGNWGWNSLPDDRRLSFHLGPDLADGQAAWAVAALERAWRERRGWPYVPGELTPGAAADDPR